MAYYPAPMPVAPPPKRNNTVLIVLLAVGIPVTLVLCCVGVFIGAPILGFTFLENAKEKDKAAVKPVAGKWENTDGSVRLEVSPFAGDLTVSFKAPLKPGYCQGGIEKPANPNFPVTFWQPPCGPITDASAMLKLSGSDLTLSIPGLSDIVLHQIP